MAVTSSCAMPLRVWEATPWPLLGTTFLSSPWRCQSTKHKAPTIIFKLSPPPPPQFPQLVQARAAMLLHNVTVCHAASVSVLCATAAHASHLMRRLPHVLFLDPPWPPAQSPHDRVTDIPLSPPRGFSLCQLYLRLHWRAGAAIVAAKLPLAFDVDALALDLTSKELDAGPLTNERPFPFIFSFGAIRLFVALFPPRYCLPPMAAAPPPHAPPLHSLHFCNRNLDEVIAAVRAWNSQVATGPKFFDYEAGKWIALSKWRKCSMA
jgi:hypothetical protein